METRVSQETPTNLSIKGPAGEFQITRRLGGGRIAEMGVFAASGTLRSGEPREVAIKLASSSRQEDLQREHEFILRAGKQIKNTPNYSGAQPQEIFGATDVFSLTAEGRSVEVRGLVMELMQGKPFDELMRERKFTPNEVARIITQIGRLNRDVFHKLGVTDFDFQPRNYFLEADGRVRRIDFDQTRDFNLENLRNEYNAVVGLTLRLLIGGSIGEFDMERGKIDLESICRPGVRNSRTARCLLEIAYASYRGAQTLPDLEKAYDKFLDVIGRMETDDTVKMIDQVSGILAGSSTYKKEGVELAVAVVLDSSEGKEFQLDDNLRKGIREKASNLLPAGFKSDGVSDGQLIMAFLSGIKTASSTSHRLLLVAEGQIKSGGYKDGLEDLRGALEAYETIDPFNIDFWRPRFAVDPQFETWLLGNLERRNSILSAWVCLQRKDISGAVKSLGGAGVNIETAELIGGKNTVEESLRGAPASFRSFVYEVLARQLLEQSLAFEKGGEIQRSIGCLQRARICLDLIPEPLYRSVLRISDVSFSSEGLTERLTTLEEKNVGEQGLAEAREIAKALYRKLQEAGIENRRLAEENAELKARLQKLEEQKRPLIGFGGQKKR